MKYIIPSLFIFITSLFLGHFYSISGSEVNISPDFNKYYESFLLEGRKRGFYKLNKINITIQYEQNSVPAETQLAIKNSVTLAHCRVIIGQDPIILVDSRVWNSMSHTQREMIIFHELAHCFLLKGHSDGIHENRNKSLMSTNIFNQYVYLQNREYYMNELFGYKPYHVKDYIVSFFIKPFEDMFKR